MVEEAKPVQLVDGQYYCLPTAREYVCLIPQTDTHEARIRLHLLNATTLDIPLSQKSMVALAQDLSPYMEKYFR